LNDDRGKRHLGRAVLAARKRPDLTQEALADKIHCAFESVSTSARFICN